MKHYVCIEDNERFVIEAKNMEDAKDGAALYHASVIREVTNEEEKAGVIKNERVDKDNDEKHEEEG
jgi:hypothetical protein